MGDARVVPPVPVDECLLRKLAAPDDDAPLVQVSDSGVVVAETHGLGRVVSRRAPVHIGLAIGIERVENPHREPVRVRAEGGRLNELDGPRARERTDWNSLYSFSWRMK